MNTYNEGSSIGLLNDPKSELMALNAALRSHGAPQLQFGPPQKKMRVGQVMSHRAELCSLGLHRHFLSEASFTELGVESLLLTPDVNCEDRGDRVQYVPRNAALQAAFKANAKNGRPVRIIRPAARSGSGGSGGPGGSGGGRSYRYDGVYAVVADGSSDTLPVPDAAAATAAGSSKSNSGDAAAVEAAKVVLLRAPDQAPLPHGVGNVPWTKPGKSAERAKAPPMSLVGEIIEAPRPKTLLPEYAEQCLIGEDGSGVIADMTVGEALSKLIAAREALLKTLSPEELYGIMKRNAMNQLRIRGAIRQLCQPHHGSYAELPSNAPMPAPSAVLRKPWPTRRKVAS